MSTHKYIDRICVAALVLSLLLALLFVNKEALGIQTASRAVGYEKRLFDTTRVHTIDLVMEDWESFLETCESEEYASCSAVIDGEAYRNIGLRAKGNTSLSAVSAMGSDRYSLKLEFDHYDTGKTYYGLDKLCLNNVIQDNTYLKDYLTYRMMAEFGVVAPLCGFVYITVNGEDWGLYLAVEGVEESFLQRNYGSGYGDLYKPDTLNFGGGRGNGQGFDPAVAMENQRDGGALPEGGGPAAPGEGASPFGGMGDSGVKLQYVDDDPESYSSIFSSAKTDVTEADQARLIRALKTLGEDGAEAVDVDQVLRYFVVHNFVVNGDSYTGSMVHNYYFYEEDGRLAMIPWDYNLAFGTFRQTFGAPRAGEASSAVNDPIDTPLSATGDGDRPMVDWILSDPVYTERYHQYFSDFLETVDPVAILEEAHGLIVPYVERDPTKFCASREFETGVKALETFCRLRAESVAGQLAGTIPTTNVGQSAQSEVLVDAAGLTLSDMGTMSMGGVGHGGPNGGGPRQDAAQVAGEAPSMEGEQPMEGSPPTEGGQVEKRPTGEERPAFAEMGGPGQRMPGGFQAEISAAPESYTLLLLGVSTLALLVGLGIVWRYRRYGRPKTVRKSGPGRSVGARETADRQ